MRFCGLYDVSLFSNQKEDTGWQIVKEHELENLVETRQPSIGTHVVPSHMY